MAQLAQLLLITPHAGACPFGADVGPAHRVRLFVLVTLYVIKIEGATIKGRPTARLARGELALELTYLTVTHAHKGWPGGA